MTVTLADYGPPIVGPSTCVKYLPIKLQVLLVIVIARASNIHCFSGKFLFQVSSNCPTAFKHISVPQLG